MVYKIRFESITWNNQVSVVSQPSSQGLSSFCAVKVVLTFESVDEILVWNSNKGYCAILSCEIVYYAVQGGSTFESVNEIL